MDDLEQPAVPESEAAGNAAAEDENLVVDDQQDDVDPDAVSQEEAAEEEDEIEVDGKKFVMPKSAAEKLKSERLMHADYTQKTQAVAEERKAIAAEREQNQRHQQEAQMFIGDLAKIQSIDERLAEYKALNWDELSDNDPQTFQKLDRQMRALEASRNEVAQAITQKQHENALSEQQALAKQIQDADTYFKREIQGWSPERSTRLQQYAIEQGIPAEVLGQAVIRQPALAKILHKAEMFDQLEKKQAAVKPKPPVQEKPVTRITAARTSVNRDPDKMPIGEWAEWFAKQRKK